MELQGVQQQNVQNQGAGPRRSRCISLCRRFTYLDPVDGLPPATCKERSIGGLGGYCVGTFFGVLTSRTALEIIKKIVSSGVSVSDIVASNICFSILGICSTTGAAFGIAHPPRLPETFGYQEVPNDP